jgi:hypothetical protein
MSVVLLAYWNAVIQRSLLTIELERVFVLEVVTGVFDREVVVNVLTRELVVEVLGREFVDEVLVRELCNEVLQMELHGTMTTDVLVNVTVVTCVLWEY